MRTPTLLLVLMFATLIAARPAQASPQVPAGVAQFLDAQGEAGFSGVFLVAKDGDVLVRSYGLADREWGIPNSPDTKFRIGSLTKQFTAAGILLLVADGKLSLDDPVCRHVDHCPAAWKPIVIRQLLNHSSGIHDFVRLPGMRDRFTLPAKLDETIALLERQPLDFPPGTDARYGNSGLLIAASIIERLGGQPYADFIRDRIYRPLGMDDSGYAWDGPLLQKRAHGYVQRDGVLANAPYIDMSIPVGAGSQYSTALDLYRWDRALRTDALLPARLRAEMFRAGKGGYGLGWEIAQEDGREVIEHNGDINGFGAFIARWPQDDAVVVVLTNTEGTKVRDLKDAIASRLFAVP
jgi:CubicO group peptidase (beta-lactamase class C family)